MIEVGRGGAEGDDPGERENSRNGSYKLDLYSIPVFLLEVVVLIGLAYSAYYIHFQYQHEPLISGFYCDDIAYRHQFVDSNFTNQFTQYENELTATALLLTIPIVLIIFCELVNSMFGALNFRQIRALCKCCKLHSITRRTLRFSAAYLLGFLIVMISCDILASSTGRLRPYFAQDCPKAYSKCPTFLSSSPTSAAISNIAAAAPAVAPNSASSAPFITPPASQTFNQLANQNSQQASVINGSGASSTSSMMPSSTSQISLQHESDSTKLTPSELISPPINGRIKKRAITTTTTLRSLQTRLLVEREWVDLTNKNLQTLCGLTSINNLPSSSSSDQSDTSLDNNNNNNDQIIDPKLARARQIAMSWPSYPAAILTYAILFTSCYLCFVGTARPTRLITCILVMVLLLANVIFNVQLIKEHYNHWEDVVSSSLLALVVVIFVLYVYLNKFRDTHYYENQKLIKPRRIVYHEHFKGYSNDGAIGEFNHLDKIDNGPDGLQSEIRTNSNANLHSNGGDNNGSISNNDLAMRYFQIPRANYRGAPRPLSSLNQML